ncbi:EutN/CcmL family microcompartment protein [Actinomycetospora sp. TBRC 11914]|uniref:EutN/CcmL family microcompartment protein n=1 Tax=Actinomycetospora sp. TBRC 11914 TaxID=2729387 RepID=UPI00145FB7DD|nr:EutN/CcmL family microcompartment protein [Actinomycetospora sp. TBRC 11914]NMO90976.1 EutN/CcmL family microcompartment protein [Actinomycetospora sp. TBRC 11914]
MQLGRVLGQVVATVRSPGFENVSLLLVQDATAESDPEPETFVAVDLVGAGNGDVVLMTTGSAARVAAGDRTPTDRAVVAIADSVIRHGTVTYRTA